MCRKQQQQPFLSFLCSYFAAAPVLSPPPPPLFASSFSKKQERSRKSIMTVGKKKSGERGVVISVCDCRQRLRPPPSLPLTLLPAPRPSEIEALIRSSHEFVLRSSLAVDGTEPAIASFFLSGFFFGCVCFWEFRVCVCARPPIVRGLLLLRRDQHKIVQENETK